MSHVVKKSLFVDFLCRRIEGALLVSGKRGVDKTSLVFSAVHKASKQLAQDNIAALPVLVNAPNFEIRKGIDARSWKG
jgi:hypothetical protein